VCGFSYDDLPYGRGGSPLQNLIALGYQTTRLSAIRVTEGLDSGEVYLKKELNLGGTAEEIFLRASGIMEEMIHEIIEKRPVPLPQSGEPVVFKRRKPEQSNILEITSLEKLYDQIRMLDADGYPKAFLETEHFRLEFSRASLKKDCLLADVRVIKK
jgi:methionyl-tRNA formyltransferase